MLNYSISRRSIYPGLEADTELNLSNTEWAHSTGEHINSTFNFDREDVFQDG